MPSSDRGLAAIVFIDVVGYTKMSQAKAFCSLLQQRGPG